MHAAIAAFPAFAFQALTASEREGPMGAGRRGDHRTGGRRDGHGECVRTAAPAPGDGTTYATPPSEMRTITAPAPPAPIAAEPQSKPSSMVRTTGVSEGAGSDVCGSAMGWATAAGAASAPATRPAVTRRAIG